MKWDEEDRAALRPAEDPSAAVLAGEIVGLRVALALIWERVMELAPPDWRPWVDKTTFRGLREVDKVDFDGIPARHRDLAKERAREVAIMTLTISADLQERLDRR